MRVLSWLTGLSIAISFLFFLRVSGAPERPLNLHHLDPTTLPDDIDRLLESVWRAEQDSADFRIQLYAGIPQDHLLSPSRGQLAVSCDDDIISRIGTVIEREILARRKYDPAPWAERRSMCSDLRTSGVAFKTMMFPEQRLSATTLLGKVVVHLWVCPDIQTAARIFWLRRGGTIRPERKTMRAVAPDRKGGIIEGDKYPGDSAYEYNPRLMVNIPLKKMDANESRLRLGFVRDRLVVEIQTASYFYDSEKQAWYTTGMSRAERKSMLDMLVKIDEVLESLQD